MDADLKKILKAVVLEMRHELEGYYDNAGRWHPGDLETRLAEIGVRKDRASVPVDELGRLIDQDVRARKIVDAFIDVREQAGVDRAEAVAEYVRESAYTWANRLVALRCMEARELLDDEVIVGREAYGGRSLVHHRLAQSSPELCTGEDDGRFAMLAQVFAERAITLTMLFDPDSASIALRPSPAALKNCLAWLSGTQKVRSQEPATDAVFAAPDALGWAYQYWNTEEKDRVFETVRTTKDANIEGADIIPATQLYTEGYMVKFLVQNSLGATWMGLHPESKLYEAWEYYIRDADRAPYIGKSLSQITLLDPACGSGHFLIEAFDMFYAMYEEEGLLKDPQTICRSILENNLFGIDIDERAIQIAEASLWMKAEERAFAFGGATTNLVAANSSHLKGESWERFLALLSKEPSVVRVLRKFAKSIEHIHELGSLVRPAEELRAIINVEHRLWEEQVRNEKEANFLFPDMIADALDGRLPFDEITDEQFGHRMMNRAMMAIDGFTKDARDKEEFDDQLVGKEARVGFRLLDLLSRTFSIVIANPPYLGSQSMGTVLQSHIESNWSYAKRDLYAAFIARAKELSNFRLALVTQQAWLFLKQMHHLRDAILPNVGIETLAHLGPGAFNEISGAHVNVVLFTAFVGGPEIDHHTTAVRPEWMSGPESISSFLKRAALNAELAIRVRQADLLELPLRPFIYWCPKHFLDLLRDEQTLDQVHDVTYTASANARFVRYFWELKADNRWRNYSKGGGFRKWEGLNSYCVDWGRRGERVASHVRDAYPPDKFSLWIKQPPPERDTVVWSEIGSGSLGARRACSGTVISRTGPAVFSDSNDELHTQLLLLNSRVVTYLLRLTCSGLHFAYPYVAKIPFPPVASSSLLVSSIMQFAKRVSGYSLLDQNFDPANIFAAQAFLNRSADEVRLHLLEGIAEQIAFSAYRLDQVCRQAVLTDTGIPAGWRPLLDGVAHPALFVDTNTSVANEVADFVAELPVVKSGDKSEQLIRQFFGGNKHLKSIVGLEDVSEEPEALEEEVITRLPVPACSLIESLAAYLDLNPLSVFSLICAIHSKDRTVFIDEERLLSFDQCTVVVLQLLGYRWPSQLGSDETESVFVDDDGIIPLTDVAKEPTLQERVAVLLQQREFFKSDFTSLVGKSLGEWLTKDFFKHHTNQFKKRPIGWQLQTSSFTSRKTPVFSCLAYGHRMDVDTIPKIRAQYTGPLKLRFETEMRGISATPTANRTDNQAKRAVELEEAIVELQAFDERLASIANTAFGPDSLLPSFRQYAFDDAMLSMKACWLQRLSLLLTQLPGNDTMNGIRKSSLLDDWQDQATKTLLHQDLAVWIGQALSHLSYFCSQVGPNAPDAKRIREDPINAVFGSLIQAEIDLMQTRSMKLACGVWWGKFDAAVLAPIRERLKILKAEQKELNAAIKEDRQPVLVAEKVLGESAEDGDSEATRVADDMPLFGNDHAFEQTIELTKAAMKARLNEVKAKIKKFTEEMDSKAGKAQAIRDSIQAWRLPDPIPDSLDFLPSSPTLPPLFDQVSSLDERRAPPKTIAEFIAQESLYAPDINDGVRVNIAPLQKAGILAADVLAPKDVDKAIADRAEWRADERRWVREGKLPQPGWWKAGMGEGGGMKAEETGGSSGPTDGVACKQFVSDGKEDK